MALLIIGTPLVLLAALLVGLFAVPAMLVTLPLIALGTVLFLIPGTSQVERMVIALAVLALGIVSGVEVLAINVDIGRQNMVFKFYIQAWLIFSVSAGVALAWLLPTLRLWESTWRGIWQGMLALLLAISFLYPLMATQGRWLDRFDGEATGTTLDGQAFMQHAVYGQNNVWFNFIGDYQMIRWLETNIEGTPTILEAPAIPYQWGSRIAIHTGLPTVIGWDFHQRQQRGLNNLTGGVWSRSNTANTLYQTPDVSTAWELIQFYDIEYIIVGVWERVQYDDLLQDPVTGDLTGKYLSPGLEKFEQMVEMGLLEVVYESPSCVVREAVTVDECNPENIVMDKIYRVVPGATIQNQGG
jgi:uncharacterized membrane protein